MCLKNPNALWVEYDTGLKRKIDIVNVWESLNKKDDRREKIHVLIDKLTCVVDRTRYV